MEQQAADSSAGGVPAQLPDDRAAALYAELLGARVRCTGFASSREIGAALGGFSPLVASALVIQGGGTGWSVAVWMVITALISLAAFALSRETEDLDITAPETVQR